MLELSFHKSSLPLNMRISPTGKTAKSTSLHKLLTWINFFKKLFRYTYIACTICLSRWSHETQCIPGVWWTETKLDECKQGLLTNNTEIKKKYNLLFICRWFVCVTEKQNVLILICFYILRIFHLYSKRIAILGSQYAYRLLIFFKVNPIVENAYQRYALRPLICF